MQEQFTLAEPHRPCRDVVDQCLAWRLAALAAFSVPTVEAGVRRVRFPSGAAFLVSGASPPLRRWECNWAIPTLVTACLGSVPYVPDGGVQMDFRDPQIRHPASANDNVREKKLFLWSLQVGCGGIISGLAGDPASLLATLRVTTPLLWGFSAGSPFGLVVALFVIPWCLSSHLRSASLCAFSWGSPIRPCISSLSFFVKS
ncbi:hypothetical protein CONLIGDRAFT_69403 [Coniochaeta ligniaria NRRL 30616]|uniref:Uncharacterized protein n=1 Tax=Coniochaeta ligniaria NRRL 30616 TaxID=1408157 RepID=A0A1J7JB66_9PEZI|nr:hypothetical protein CONLIGDRAFT_69403 [Coniochaeta ligniaria NRRL 30616]